MAALPRCPSCRAQLPTPTHQTCARCGFDLQLVSADFHRLTQAPTGATVLPFLTLRKLSKAGRLAVCRAIEAARRG